MSERSEMENFTLPEQRHHVDVRYSRTRRHIIRMSTFPAGSYPGRWTRRAADYRSVCGSISYTLTGIDAEDWGMTKVPRLDISDVDCQRCLERGGKWAAA